MKKKVLHFYYRFQMGGSENLTLSVIKNITDYEHEILVIQGNTHFQKFCKEKHNIDFLNLNIKTNSFLSISKWLSIYRAVKKINPDIIHAYMFDSSMYARIIGFLLNKPIIIYIVNTYNKKKVRRGVINFLLSFFTKKIIVCSDDVKKDVLKYDKIKSNKLITVNSFATLDFHKDYSIDLCRDYNLATDDFKLLTIARIVEQKGLFVLIEAVEICVRINKLTSIKLFIVGDGPLNKNLKSYISSKNLNKYVFLVGEQNNINAYLTQCEAYVDSSLWAGMNVATIKALEAKLPLVITDVGGAKKLTRNGQFGILCKPNDQFSLARGIKMIFKNKNKNKNNADDAYMHIQKNYSDKNAANKIKKVYNEILIL